MQKMRLRFVFASILLLAIGSFSATAQAQCLEAVFFDLGDTLVENPGDGIFVLRAGAAETIAELQAFGTQLGVITNVPGGWEIEDLEAILAEPEFLDEFDTVILSSQAPASKPDPAIYTFAHGTLPVPQAAITDTVFVGETLGEIADSEVAPTEGARSVGMIGIHLSDAAPSPLADFTIASDDLPQVVAIVKASCGVFDDDFETGDTTGWSLAVPVEGPGAQLD